MYWIFKKINQFQSAVFSFRQSRNLICNETKNNNSMFIKFHDKDIFGNNRKSYGFPLAIHFRHDYNLLQMNRALFSSDLNI